MKKIILSALLLIFSTQLIYAQYRDSLVKTSPQELHYYYIQKRNANRTWGWIMLTSGVAMFVAGTAINVSQGWGEGNQNKGVGLSIAGIGTSLISIPLFIGAGKNNRKAKKAIR